MINKIRKVILLITTILFACHLQVAGKEFFVSKQSIPDFKFIFDKLSQNRITYNRYNDSIFSIHNHDEWVRFFMTRSRKNHLMYHENAKLLNSIADYFETDMADTTKETILPDAAYDSLYKNFFHNYAYALTDPFITNRVTDILIRNFRKRPERNYEFLRAMSWKGSSYYQIWRLNRDNETLKKSIRLHRIRSRQCALPYARRIGSVRLCPTGSVPICMDTPPYPTSEKTEGKIRKAGNISQKSYGRRTGSTRKEKTAMD